MPQHELFGALLRGCFHEKLFLVFKPWHIVSTAACAHSKAYTCRRSCTSLCTLSTHIQACALQPNVVVTMHTRVLWIDAFEGRLWSRGTGQHLIAGSHGQTFFHTSIQRTFCSEIREKPSPQYPKADLGPIFSVTIAIAARSLIARAS